MDVGWNAILKRAEQGYYIKETVNMLRNSSQSAGFGGFGNENRVEGSAQVQLPETETFTLDDSEGIQNRAKGLGNHNTNIAVYECAIEIVPRVGTREWDLS